MLPASTFLTLLPVCWIQPAEVPLYLKETGNLRATIPPMQPVVESPLQLMLLEVEVSAGSGLRLVQSCQKIPSAAQCGPFGSRFLLRHSRPTPSSFRRCTKHPHLRSDPHLKTNSVCFKLMQFSCDTLPGSPLLALRHSALYAHLNCLLMLISINRVSFISLTISSQS